MEPQYHRGFGMKQINQSVTPVKHTQNPNVINNYPVPAFKNSFHVERKSH